MRIFVLASLGFGLLFPTNRASATPLQPYLVSSVESQLSFEGLDLSDESPPKDKDKNTPENKKQPTRRKRKTPSGGSSRAPASPEKEKSAPVMTFDAVDVSGKSAERQRLEAAIKVFNDENYQTAAIAFHEILKDSRMAGLHEEAQYFLAKTLYRMKMYHSSLNRFKIILAKGPSSRFFKSGLEWLFFIAHKTVNEQIVLDEVAKWSQQEFPRRFRSEFRYLLARYHFYRGKALEDAGQPEEAKKSLAEAKQIVWSVARNDPFYSQAKYLQGSIQFMENDFESSLNSFREVVRFNNPRSNPDSDIPVRELAFMQLARIHYGHRQNRNAIFYYDKVKPGSDQWLEALFEASWAHFRIGSYERALGNLITLSSPFFRDEYFPETLILKAVIYYENCRYREARSILEEFEKIYMPVHDELQKITSKNMEPKQYYAILEEIQKSNKNDRKRLDRHLERILKLALTDTDFKLVNQSILELEQEMDSITEKRDVFRYSELAKAILSELKEERSALTARAGILAKAKLEFEIGQLRELLGNALRIRFETTTQEKKFLEDQLIAKGTKQKLKAYKYSVAVPDERVYWPFEGEYWRDELGTYEYTLTRGCQNR